MEVVVDGRKGVIDIIGSQNLLSVIDVIRKHATDRKRVITSLELDGEQLSPERQAELSLKMVAEFKILDVKTAEPHEFSISILQELKPHLDNLDKIHTEAAMHIHSGNLKSALEKLHSSFLGWRAFFSGITGIGIITNINFGSIVVDGTSINDRLQKLTALLNKFAGAFTKQDIVSMGDIAEYELKPLVYDWYSVIDNIIKVVKEGGQNGNLHS